LAATAGGFPARRGAASGNRLCRKCLWPVRHATRVHRIRPRALVSGRSFRDRRVLWTSPGTHICALERFVLGNAGAGLGVGVLADRCLRDRRAMGWAGGGSRRAVPCCGFNGSPLDRSRTAGPSAGVLCCRLHSSAGAGLYLSYPRSLADGCHFRRSSGAGVDLVTYRGGRTSRHCRGGRSDCYCEAGTEPRTAGLSRYDPGAVRMGNLWVWHSRFDHWHCIRTIWAGQERPACRAVRDHSSWFCLSHGCAAVKAVDLGCHPYLRNDPVRSGRAIGLVDHRSGNAAATRDRFEIQMGQYGRNTCPDRGRPPGRVGPDPCQQPSSEFRTGGPGTAREPSRPCLFVTGPDVCFDRQPEAVPPAGKGTTVFALGGRIADIRLHHTGDTTSFLGLGHGIDVAISSEKC